MTAVLHVTAERGAGRLATIAHPRGDAWPADRLGELADVGVSVLVSALTSEEQVELAHGDTVEAAAEVGMDFIAFPPTDGGISRDEATKVILLAGRLAANVRAGRYVAVQCFGGIGRSTLLACTTMVLLGIPPGDALRRVTDDPESPVTRDWLHRQIGEVMRPLAESEHPGS
jgi:protein-tyrosine phosphatase